MSDSEQSDRMEIKVDADNLYREDVFTDVRAATIRRMVPVHVDGSQDYGRKTVFMGFTQLVTEKGMIPFSFAIPAKNLKEAVENFPEALQATVAHMVEEAKKREKEESSRIILPGAQGDKGTIIR
ncbi:MAG TPA: hypothetical protein PKY58_12755 [Syntrophales bacterium]|nr:hypothetical protein [Syntrophales bacterium]HPX11836.1 hypothetical protein [Syntrophales bacterium]HQB31469.1 hypothetical protein [Syntrophales bacterium]HQN79199.1 hypothetical protein [Syntrophales bacterium]HQQ28387.1 hypothetical protein [Syntrophales bacterium]